MTYLTLRTLPQLFFNRDDYDKIIRVRVNQNYSWGSSYAGELFGKGTRTEVTYH